MANNRKIVLRATLESGWSASSGSGRKSDAGLSRNHIATEELSVSSERNEAVGNAPTGKGKASKKRKKKGRKANRLDSAMEGTEPTTVTDDTDGFAQNPSQITFASGKLFDLGVLNKLQLARWYTLSSGGSSDLGKLSAWAEIAEAAPFKLNTGLNRRVLMVTEKDTPGSQKKKKRKNDDQEKQPSEPKPKQIPHTLETLREKDATTVAVDDEEVLEDEQTDEMGSYFQRATAPRLLVTTSDKARKVGGKFPTEDLPCVTNLDFLQRSIALARELAGVIPNAEYKSRRRFALKKIIPECVTHGITDIIVINENRDKPDALTLCHLPNGPTAVFKLRSVKLTKEIKNVGEMTDHHPEVILTNFSTRLGHTVGRMFASLFPHDPNFQGRRAVTFYNQRDFVFFRNHRYIFRNAERVGLQELGPKFTMKLRSLQKGTFDSMQGEYLWIHKQLEMNKSRRKFFL